MNLDSPNIILDINESWKRLARYNKVSWSRLNEFGICKAQWFVRNHSHIVNIDKVVLEHTRAIPGTLIQKMFEIFINDRVYARPEMKTIDSLYNWFSQNSPLLFDLLVFSVESQYQTRMKNPRYFFRRKDGKSRVASFHVKGLDPCFRKGFQPNFIDWEFFNTENGSREKFLKRINSLYKPILELFLSYNLDLNKMISETFIEAPLTETISITGQIDFIYNKHQRMGRFNSLPKIQSNYIIIDGKHKISKFVKEEQLMFYSALISLKYQKVPGAIAFLDWTNACFDFREFNPNYIDILRGKVGAIVEEGYKLRVLLGELKKNPQNQYISLYELPLEYEPSFSNCIFCPINQVCRSAEKIQEMNEGINNKRECQEFLRIQKFDENKEIQEIDLTK